MKITRSNQHLFLPLLLLLLVDLILILVHLNYYQYSLFNLDIEANIPTIYQGAKIFAGAFLAFLAVYIIGHQKKQKSQRTLLPRRIIGLLGAGLFFLGLDEVGTIHENIFTYLAELFPEQLYGLQDSLLEAGYLSTNWLLFYIPLFLAAGVFGIYAAIKLVKTYPHYIWLLIIGFLLIFCIPVIEYLNTAPDVRSSELYYLWTALEEGIEMIALSLLVQFCYVVVVLEEGKLTSV